MPHELTPFEKEMETLLSGMKAELRKKMEENDNDFKKSIESSGLKDSIDLATDDIDVHKMEAISRVDANRLQAIEQAIIRIKNGKYGFCAQCGQSIPQERLRALPYAMLCMNCKKQNERF